MATDFTEQAELNAGVDLEFARRSVRLLNEVRHLDPRFIQTLIFSRLECNNALADHPTIQVRDSDGVASVSVIGILNGIAGVYSRGKYRGFGPIAVSLNELTGVIEEFRVIENMPGELMEEEDGSS